MIISCSLSGIVDFDRPGQGIIDIVNAGFENILLDISMGCNEHELEYFGKSTNGKGKTNAILENPSNLSGSFQKVLDKCAEKKLNVPVVYAPRLKRDTKRMDLNELLEQLTVESIQLCGSIGSKYIIVSPVFAGMEKDKLWETNREFYLRLADIAKEYDVQILIQNQCRSHNGHLVRGLFSDAVQTAQWLDELNTEAGEERFGFCMDTGACNLCGQDMREFALGLGERIKAVILRDCDGQQENAMLPFTCVNQKQPQTNWLSLIRGLREIGFDGQLILDITDTAAAFSPILRPQLMLLAKSVIDYFKWQIEIENWLKKYDSIVLFGAGNMCRNYMKCYGEKYPPLYTCDNNRNLWGTMFCGLEVKSPESLKELPKDCAVFICNIYYREIEKQLRDMGLTNPIEFFNDEYMPTFYFDRLEGEGRK